MTVALLAQRHRRNRYVGLLAVALVALILGGGLSAATSVQTNIARQVTDVLGITEVPIEIRVDGRDVTLISDGPITATQQDVVGAVPYVGRVIVRGGE